MLCEWSCQICWLLSHISEDRAGKIPREEGSGQTRLPHQSNIWMLTSFHWVLSDLLLLLLLSFQKNQWIIQNFCVPHSNLDLELTTSFDTFHWYSSLYNWEHFIYENTRKYGHRIEIYVLNMRIIDTVRIPYTVYLACSRDICMDFISCLTCQGCISLETLSKLLQNRDQVCRQCICAVQKSRKANGASTAI